MEGNVENRIFESLERIEKKFDDLNKVVSDHETRISLNENDVKIIKEAPKNARNMASWVLGTIISMCVIAGTIIAAVIALYKAGLLHG